MRSLEEVRNAFAFHPATSETAPQHARVRETFDALLEPLWKAVPNGPEKTLMYRALQEAQMWANAAVALTPPVASPRVLSPEDMIE